jgi:hypothetical protein
MKKLALFLLIAVSFCIISSGCGTGLLGPEFPVGDSTLTVFVYAKVGDSWVQQSNASVILYASNETSMARTTERSAPVVGNAAQFDNIANETYELSCWGTSGAEYTRYDPYWQSIPVTVSGNTSFTLDESNANMVLVASIN